jgi:hypothetical protein
MSINDEVNIPKWFIYLIISSYLGLMIMIGYLGEKHAIAQKKLERQSYLRQCFSRMSTDPEIKEAYNDFFAVYDTLGYESP